MSIAFPGYVSDVHSADALDPAWGNAIRDRAIQVFDTATNRDAAITVPQTGQVGVLTTLGTAGLYVRAGATAGWRAPWNLPWGVVALAEVVAAQTGITTEVDITSLTVTFTALANRWYKTSIAAPINGTSGDTCRVKLTDTTPTQIDSDQVTFGATSSVYKTECLAIESPAAGSVTRKGRIVRQAGAGGTVAMAASGTQPAWITVEDIGPNGAPS